MFRVYLLDFHLYCPFFRFYSLFIHFQTFNSHTLTANKLVTFHKHFLPLFLLQNLQYSTLFPLFHFLSSHTNTLTNTQNHILFFNLSHTLTSRFLPVIRSVLIYTYTHFTDTGKRRGGGKVSVFEILMFFIILKYHTEGE